MGGAGAIAGIGARSAMYGDGTMSRCRTEARRVRRGRGSAEAAW